MLPKNKAKRVICSAQGHHSLCTSGIWAYNRASMYLLTYLHYTFRKFQSKMHMTKYTQVCKSVHLIVAQLFVLE